MNPKNINEESSFDASLAPFVVEFTKAIIYSLIGINFPRPKQDIIHSDMVPKFSQHVISASMKERTIQPKVNFIPSILKFEIPRPIKQKPRMIQQIQQLPTPTPNIVQPINSNPEMAWEKIQPLLIDPSVTHIECLGPGKQLMVSRAGQRQITRIILSDLEIKKILETISEKSHIPLLEGVFRAAIEDLSLNAVISEIIGSKFVIKKNSPYSLLEG
jgi:hypothetical protein